MTTVDQAWAACEKIRQRHAALLPTHQRNEEVLSTAESNFIATKASYLDASRAYSLAKSAHNRAKNTYRSSGATLRSLEAAYSKAYTKYENILRASGWVPPTTTEYPAGMVLMIDSEETPYWVSDQNESAAISAGLEHLGVGTSVIGTPRFWVPA